MKAPGAGAAVLTQLQRAVNGVVRRREVEIVFQPGTQDSEDWGCERAGGVMIEENIVISAEVGTLDELESIARGDLQDEPAAGETGEDA